MMKTDEALALVRNPWGHSEALVREARITVCDRLEAAERYAVEWEQLARQYRDKRDALATHVERLTGLLERAQQERIPEQGGWVKLSAPNMARLIAQKQAEAYAGALSMVEQNTRDDAIEALYRQTLHLRRQAEEQSK